MPQWLKDLGNWFADIVKSHPIVTGIFIVGLIIIILTLIFTDQLSMVLSTPWD